MPEQIEKMEKSDKRIAINVKLTPVDHSDQPMSANYSTVTVAQGIAYVDLGFIEPQCSPRSRVPRMGKPFPKVLKAH